MACSLFGGNTVKTVGNGGSLLELTTCDSIQVGRTTRGQVIPLNPLVGNLAEVKSSKIVLPGATMHRVAHQ